MNQVDRSISWGQRLKAASLFLLAFPAHAALGSREVCRINREDLDAIRGVMIPVPRPWEREQSVPLEEREGMLSRLMDGIRKALGIATTEFGNKYGHLEAMRTVSQEVLDLQEPIFPRFRPVSLKPFIQDIVMGQICEGAHAGAEEALTELRETIHKTPFLIDPRILQEFQSEFVIVRSSCNNEDNEEAPNAGMYRSEIVPLEPEEVSAAVRRVVASCYRRPEDLCSENPSFGTFIQEHIGEMGDEVPISAVHVSGTPSVTTATFGQGKGVVKGGVAVHTFHCIPSAIQPDARYCHAHTPPIRERWELASNGEPVIVSNPDWLAAQPTLTPELLDRIDRIALLAKLFFQCQIINLELVIREDSIYAVQFRCLAERRALHASYIDADLPNARPVEILTPGNASVLVIDDPRQILTASTLRAAEGAFTSAHRVAIVSTPEPENSHPVVNFRNANRLAIRMPTIDLPPVPFAICPQTEQIFPWSPELADQIHPGLFFYSGTLPFSFSSAPRLAPALRTLVYRQDLDALDGNCRDLIDRIRQIRCHASLSCSHLQDFSHTLTRSLQELRALAPDDPRRPFFNKLLVQALRVELPTDLFLQYQDELPHLIDLLPLAEQLPSQEAFEHWKHILRLFDAQTETHQTIRSFVSLLDQIGAFPLWLHLFPPDSLASFHLSEEDRQMLALIPSFGRSTQWQTLQEQAESLSSPSFIASFRDASPFIRMIIVSQMFTLIERFDAELKGIKNPELFRSILIPFFHLLKQWLQIPLSSNRDRLHLSPFLHAHLNAIVHKLSPLGAHELQTSPNLNVAAILADLDKRGAYAPGLLDAQRLADAFTCIHQFLLRDCSQILVALLDTRRALLPMFLKEILNKFIMREERTYMPAAQIADSSQQVFYASIVRCSIDKQSIVMKLNVPLSAHGTMLEVAAHRSGSSSITIQFLGLGPRIQPMIRWMQILKKSGIFPDGEAEELQGVLEWRLTTDKYDLLMDCYFGMIRYTFNETFSAFFGQIDGRTRALLINQVRHVAYQQSRSDLEQDQIAALHLWENLVTVGHFTDALAWLRFRYRRGVAMRRESEELRSTITSFLFVLEKAGIADRELSELLGRWQQYAGTDSFLRQIAAVILSRMGKT